MLEQPIKNKMMTTPPAKKEFFFAPTSEHYAEYILAETIQEAEKIYHKIKRPIYQTLSTPPEPEKKDDEGVQ